MSVVVGGTLFGCLIGCFVLILSFCISLKMLRCQLVSDGQKIPPLCHDRIVVALLNALGNIFHSVVALRGVF
jgi:hypothetical protein